MMETNFVKVPLRRGVTEILPIYKAIRDTGGIICGGYVRYMASPRIKPVEAKDVDIYCKEDQVFNDLRTMFGLHLEERNENPISVTYKTTEEGMFAYCPVIQLIKPIKEGAIVAKGTVKEIVMNFDFTVVRAAMVNRTTALVDEQFEEDERNKYIRLKNIHCPVSSMLRCMKYARKGYFMRPSQALLLFNDWTDRDEAYRTRLLELFGNSDSDGEMTQEDIDELEALLRID